MNTRRILMVVFCLLALQFGKAQMQLNDGDKKVFTVYPAVVKSSAKVVIDADHDMWATLEVVNDKGEVVLEQQMAVNKGLNNIPVFFVSTLSRGVYSTVLRMEDKIYSSRIEKE